jgi:wyosine [tRNA(Phe)-imidazoG37] synthetase (radical SAM superfamily)
MENSAQKAFQEINESLDNLFTELENIENEHRSEIEQIVSIINSYNTDGESTQEYINFLIKLSNAVAEVKIEAKRITTSDQSTKMLASLTVPPYDLLLPFKAVVFSSRSKSINLDKEMPKYIKNNRIMTMQDHFSTKNIGKTNHVDKSK